MNQTGFKITTKFNEKEIKCFRTKIMKLNFIKHVVWNTFDQLSNNLQNNEVKFKKVYHIFFGLQFFSFEIDPIEFENAN